MSMAASKRDLSVVERINWQDIGFSISQSILQCRTQYGEDVLIPTVCIGRGRLGGLANETYNTTVQSLKIGTREVMVENGGLYVKSGGLDRYLFLSNLFVLWQGGREARYAHGSIYDLRRIKIAPVNVINGRAVRDFGALLIPDSFVGRHIPINYFGEKRLPDGYKTNMLYIPPCLDILAKLQSIILHNVYPTMTLQSTLEDEE